ARLQHPTDLWNWMDAQRKAGNELLAISHNANVSDGWMYPIDIDNATADRLTPRGRQRATAISAWSRSSRRGSRRRIRCFRRPTSSPIKPILGLPANVGRIDHVTGSFARQALKDGIAMQDVRGYNPTSSVWEPVPTRTIAPALIGRIISSVFTPMP